MEFQILQQTKLRKPTTSPYQEIAHKWRHVLRERRVHDTVTICDVGGRGMKSCVTSSTSLTSHLRQGMAKESWMIAPVLKNHLYNIHIRTLIYYAYCCKCVKSHRKFASCLKLIQICKLHYRLLGGGRIKVCDVIFGGRVHSSWRNVTKGSGIIFSLKLCDLIYGWPPTCFDVVNWLYMHNLLSVAHCSINTYQLALNTKSNIFSWIPIFYKPAYLSE